MMVSSSSCWESLSNHCTLFSLLFSFRFCSFRFRCVSFDLLSGLICCISCGCLGLQIVISFCSSTWLCGGTEDSKVCFFEFAETLLVLMFAILISFLFTTFHGPCPLHSTKSAGLFATLPPLLSHLVAASSCPANFVLLLQVLLVWPFPIGSNPHE